MRRAVAIAFTLMLVTTSSASAQLWFMPDVPVPTAASPGLFIGVDVGRGLNEASGEINAVGGSLGFSGERAAFRAGVATADTEGESEITAGGAVTFDLLPAGGSTQVSLYGGAGWLEIGEGSFSSTSLRFPIGLAFKARIVNNRSATSHLWVMPRANVARLSLGDVSSTETDLGASAGISSVRSNGFVFHTVIDALFLEEDPAWTLGASIGYLFGG